MTESFSVYFHLLFPFPFYFSLRISTSIYPVPSICGADQISDWFDSLAECLHWNVRKPQKGFPKMPHIASTDSLDSTSSAESQKFNGVR